MTALEAYIEANKHKANLWDKLSVEIKSTIEKSINYGMYSTFIKRLSIEDRRILERLKYHVYWNDVCWCIVWDIKMK